jgi:uncharacterized protein YbjT (DUF2867 family)
MKYIITGSLGNISLPVTKNLVAAGQDVTVISSNAGKKSEIESLGATAAIGSVSDGAFLKRVFSDADVAYLMIPNDFSVADYPKLQGEIADRYTEAIAGSGISHVVLLSSIGADLRHGAGPIDGLGYLEEKLLGLENVHNKFLRPAYFFANLYGQIDLIKHAGITGSNFGSADEKMVFVNTSDIAVEVTKQLLEHAFTGNSVTYVAGDERFTSEIGAVLGEAAGKDGIPWVVFTDDQARQGMVEAGLSPGFAELYIQMGQAIRDGRLLTDYWKNRPATLGKYKLEDFAKSFAAAYQNS